MGEYEQRLTGTFDVIHFRRLLLPSDVCCSWTLSFLDGNPRKSFCHKEATFCDEHVLDQTVS
jgi:hypothetical protein